VRGPQALFAGIVGDRCSHSTAPFVARTSSMRLQQHHPGATSDIIRTVREARFACGVTCPRCAAPAAVRWGSFAGRQRYRCKSCRRTFSDLTRTAFAYTKKIDSWPHYLVLMRQGRTLRTSALMLGIHVSTAFRWRHALLTPMRIADSTVLDGTVELMELSFAHSLKGSRRLSTSRRRGARTAGRAWHDVPRDRVLLAVSRSGRSDARTIGGDMVVISLVSEWARTRLARCCTIFGRMTRLGPCASPIRAAGHDYQMLRAISAVGALDTRHTRNVEAFSLRLRTWLLRFRGVASRYRDNYFVWHRRADLDSDLLWARAMTVECIWPAGGGKGDGGGDAYAKRPP
jgi:transposase-like protein